MLTHDNDHGDKEKEKEKEQAAAHQHEEAALDLGPEPGPRVMASAPAGGTTERKAVDEHGRDLGNFLLTHYTFALESDPIHATSPKVSAPGLPADKKYRKSFLASPYGIKMQGTGLAEDGHYIRYQGNDQYAYGVGGAAGAPVAWKTVAVDPSVIKLGSHLDIEAYQSKGTFEAKDTGGAIKGKHIDVFAGPVPIKQAYALGTKHSEVFLVNGSGGGGQQGRPGSRAGALSRAVVTPRHGPSRLQAGAVAGGGAERQGVDQARHGGARRQVRAGEGGRRPGR